MDKRHVIHVHESVVDSIHSIEALGKKKFSEYQKSVILDRTKAIYDLIERNSLALFKRPKPRPKTKQEKQVTML